MDIADLEFKLNELARLSLEKHADLEEIHFQADSLLLEYINENCIIKAFNAIEKYYA